MVPVVVVVVVVAAAAVVAAIAVVTLGKDQDLRTGTCALHCEPKAGTLCGFEAPVKGEHLADV